MKPVNIGGHSAYQDRVLSQSSNFFLDIISSFFTYIWGIIGKLEALTFLKWIRSCRTAILLLALNRDSLLICSVRFLSLWDFGSLLIPNELLNSR